MGGDEIADALCSFFPGFDGGFYAADIATDDGGDQARIDELLPELAPFERIKKLALLPKEFSLEAGELTPTLKVKRRVIEQRYKDLIDRMYEGAA